MRIVEDLLAIEMRLGISVPPSDVRLIPGPQDPYKWASLPEKSYLFKKHLSKLCIRAYKEIYTEVGESFEAVPADASSYAAVPSATRLETPPEGLGDTGVATRPGESFTARIDELMDCNARLEMELEQWRLAASQADLLNRELGVRLEAAQTEVNSLQQENNMARETCRRNTSAAKFFCTKALQADEAIKEIFRVLESVKAKIPNISPETVTEYI